MSKNRPNQPSSFERDASGQSSPRRGPPSRPGNLPGPARLFLSLLIAWHVTAVFMAPLSVPPSSQLVLDIAQRRMQWYLDALYLNHGYHFFAPDPSFGHIISYEVLDERGQVIERGEFPDRKEQWPRLLYHRYFMLADQSELPVPDEKIRDEWLRKYMTAYARQLLRQYDGQTARVRRIIHYPLGYYEALEGKELTDPSTYEMQIEVTQTRRDLPEYNAAGQTSASRRYRQNVAGGWQGQGVRR